MKVSERLSLKHLIFASPVIGIFETWVMYGRGKSHFFEEVKEHLKLWILRLFLLQNSSFLINVEPQ